MDTIDEIKKAKILLDEGAITEEEFNLIKKEILSRAKASRLAEPAVFQIEPVQETRQSEVNKKKEPVSGKPGKDKMKFNKKELSATLLIFASLLMIIITGIMLGRNENGFGYVLIVISVALVISFAIFKLTSQLFSRFTASLIMLGIPILLIVLSLFHINIFSKYTFDPNIERIVTYQYDEDNKEIPYEIFYIRKDSFEIDGSDTIFLKTHMYEQYGDSGEIYLKGRLEDGVLRGKWMVSEENFTAYFHFDNTITYDSLLKRFEQYETENDHYDSWSKDILIDGEDYFTNGYMPADIESDGIVGGILNGDFSFYFNNKIIVKGNVNYGYLDGLISYYTPEGKIYKKINYENGRPLDLTILEEHIKTEPVDEEYGDGRIITSRLFNGNYHGPFQIFDKHGKVILEGNYVDGNEHGEVRSYGRFCSYYGDCSYALKRIETYNNGHLHGLLTSYWSEQGHYSDYHGDVINYTYAYSYGKKHGRFTKFSSSETNNSDDIWYTREYKNGTMVENSERRY